MIKLIMLLMICMQLLCFGGITASQSRSQSSAKDFVIREKSPESATSSETRNKRQYDVIIPHYGGIKKIKFEKLNKPHIGYTYSPNSYENNTIAFKEDMSGGGWFSKNCPQMIWYQFDFPKFPARVSFRGGVEPFGYHVTKWEFVASKDGNCNEYSAWDVICQDLSGEGFVNEWTSKGCSAGADIQPDTDLDSSYYNNKGYMCFGINVLEGKSSARNGTIQYADDFFLTYITMWEKVAWYYHP